HPTGYTIDSIHGFNVPSSVFSCISDLDGDGRTDVVVGVPDGLLLYSVDVAGNFTLESHLPISNVTDISIADFNGDLRPDIFVARGRTQDSDVAQFNDSAIHCSA